MYSTQSHSSFPSALGRNRALWALWSHHVSVCNVIMALMTYHRIFSSLCSHLDWDSWASDGNFVPLVKCYIACVGPAEWVSTWMNYLGAYVYLGFVTVDKQPREICFPSFFPPVLLWYDWHTTLYKVKVCSVLICHIYILWNQYKGDSTVRGGSRVERWSWGAGLYSTLSGIQAVGQNLL